MATKKKIAMILFVAIMTVLCCCVLSACNSKIKVIFNTQGGSAVQSQLKNKGEKAEQPETPVRSGYVFDGWFSTDDFSDEFDFETVLDEDVVLYAKWIKQYNVVLYYGRQRSRNRFDNRGCAA